jgi:hypothetical protein
VKRNITADTIETQSIIEGYYFVMLTKLETMEEMDKFPENITYQN